ncbi:unnamed protein product [Amaranthus hypochondriacus]
MNFEFRSTLKKSSTSDYHSPPSSSFLNPNNVSFYNHQAIRAGFTNADIIAREVEGNPNDMRKYQRELEKERIRAEIIAEEVYRRKILEDEVRRELMLERELAFRRGLGSSAMPFQSRIPLMMNFDDQIGGGARFPGSQSMPFQRDPVVAGNGNELPLGVKLKEIKAVRRPASALEGIKDNIILLAKPDVSDLKRKAGTATTVSPADQSAEPKKLKTKEEWSCALCRVTATSERALNDHLQGKKHKARESGLNSQRTGFGTGPLPMTNSTTSTNKPIIVLGISNSSSKEKDNIQDGESSLGPVDNISTQEISDTEANKSYENGKIGETDIPQKTNADAKLKNFKFVCEICRIGTHSPKVLNAHKKGKRHLAKVMEANKTTEISAQKVEVETEEKKEVDIKSVAVGVPEEGPFRKFSVEKDYVNLLDTVEVVSIVAENE